MVVQCSKCGKKYKIDSSKVTEKGVKITCPNCDNTMVVRKKVEEEEKEDFVPCVKCGSPATIDLDTDQPICESCKTKEEESAARFVPMGSDDAVGSPLDRELDLKSGDDLSFGDLSGGDYAPEAYSIEILPGKGEDNIPPTPGSTDIPPPAEPQAGSFIESPHETAASLPTEPTESFIEAPHETAASISAELSGPSDFFEGEPPPPPKSEPTPPVSPPVSELTPPPRPPAAEPTPPPSAKKPTPLPTSAAEPPIKPTAPPETIRTIKEPETTPAAPKKSSPVPLIITVALLAAIIAYLVYMLKVF